MSYLKIGLIKKPHGVKGELKVLPLTDVSSRFTKLKKIYFEKDGVFSNIPLSSVRIADSEVIFKIQGCDSRDAAESYRNMYVWIERSNGLSLDEWEFYSQDVIGLSVFYNDKKIGVVVDILNSGANDNVEIELDDGSSVYYPFRRDFIDRVDIEGGILYINQYEGFFD